MGSDLYSSLIVALFPLIIGYCIKLPAGNFILSANRLLTSLVYIILFMMGLNLAFIDNLQNNLILIIHYVLVFAFCILIVNTVVLLIVGRYLVWEFKLANKRSYSFWLALKGSCPMLISIMVGFLLGLTHWSWLKYSSHGSEIILFFLLLLVGVQLGNSKVSWRQFLLNKCGIIISFFTLLSSLLGGIIAATLLTLPWKTGLAIASSFGWYSLSSVMVNDSLGPMLGSVAFFNDLIRELIAIMFIPLLTAKRPAIALSLAGATSMDFTLPILQRAADTSIVPIAVIHGFILSLLTPILIIFFTR